MLRSNTAHLQSEDKSAEPPQEQRPRRRVTKKGDYISVTKFNGAKRQAPFTERGVGGIFS